ncbi:MAG: hypothetical protein GKR92_02940 [Gammaproteobacteria bacterium]|nr:MAG: hypothetical protein GKR92_02940 [Gammaproteobacteria bacterium]
MSGLEIGYVVLTVALLFFLVPRAKYWLSNSPKAEKGDWQAFIFPIGLIILFVAGLMWLVGR